MGILWGEILAFDASNNALIYIPNYKQELYLGSHSTLLKYHVDTTCRKQLNLIPEIHSKSYIDFRYEFAFIISRLQISILDAPIGETAFWFSRYGGICPNRFVNPLTHEIVDPFKSGQNFDIMFLQLGPISEEIWKGARSILGNNTNFSESLKQKSLEYTSANFISGIEMALSEIKYQKYESK